MNEEDVIVVTRYVCPVCGRAEMGLEKVTEQYRMYTCGKCGAGLNVRHEKEVSMVV